jgi:hypothetical protein
MSINTQDANDLAIIALSAVTSWMSLNVFQIIPAAVAVVTLIFMVKRFFEDKKKRDLEMEFMKMQMKEIRDRNEITMQDKAQVAQE